MLKQNTTAIIKWYHQSKRSLPWRQTRDAYSIWLSEVILQQTRVQQGLPYYNTFIKAFPTIDKMAQAKESELLHLWQGLGYYSRARNMHFTAQFIYDNYDGVFPSEYEKIRSLKGIGEYTAAAIASFAFDLPYVAIDGNVMRVISRLYGIEDDIKKGSTKRAITAIAKEMLEGASPALFNQSMMEFGALQCKAAGPDCKACPLNENCFAFLQNRVSDLPLKVNKTKVRNRYFNYLIIKDDDSFYIRQRLGKGIWQNLYEYPLIESNKPLKQSELIKELYTICPKGVDLKYRSKQIKHKLSHQLLHIHFNIIECAEIIISPDWKKISMDRLDDYPFPEVINKHKDLINKI